MNEESIITGVLHSAVGACMSVIYHLLYKPCPEKLRRVVEGCSEVFAQQILSVYHKPIGGLTNRTMFKRMLKDAHEFLHTQELDVVVGSKMDELNTTLSSMIGLEEEMNCSTEGAPLQLIMNVIEARCTCYTLYDIVRY